MKVSFGLKLYYFMAFFHAVFAFQLEEQENSTFPSVIPQPTNGTYAQTNELPSKCLQKTTYLQNELVIPLLITALAAYIIVIISVLTYKSKNKPK